MYGKGIVHNMGQESVMRWIQAYDISILRNNEDQFSQQEGGQFMVSRGGGEPGHLASYFRKQAVLFPIVTKTYFFNSALVDLTLVQNFVDTGTIPTTGQLEEYVPDASATGDDYRYYVDSLPYQWRIMAGRRGGDTTLSISQFLQITFQRKDSTNTIYNGTDATMEPFIGSTWGGSYPSDTQLITSWQYTDGTSVGANTDVGFGSEYPIDRSTSSPFKARKYPIPTNGKISTSDFSVSWGDFFTDNTYDYYYDRNNSQFDLLWEANLDIENSRAWYDLDLMPVAWMSDTPGGAPKTLVDGSTGVVIKLEKTGATYKGQQLLSTTKSFGSDRATLPIVDKTFFLNVAVVSDSTATSLVASGTAPTSAQCVSWSPTDPSLPYTGSSDQHLKFSLGNRTNDKSDKKIPRR